MLELVLELELEVYLGGDIWLNGDDGLYDGAYCLRDDDWGTRALGGECKRW